MITSTTNCASIINFLVLCPLVTKFYLLPYMLCSCDFCPMQVRHQLQQNSCFIPRYLYRGVYSFHLSVRPFMIPSHSWNYFSFTLMFLKWGISPQPLIRKHSYLDHRYPGGSAFIPWLLTPCPEMG